MKCAKCNRTQYLSWHVKKEKWVLLASCWWDKVLCLECFFELVSQRQRTRILFSAEDFSEIVIAGTRVRGYLNRNLEFTKKIFH